MPSKYDKLKASEIKDKLKKIGIMMFVSKLLSC
jgi:hypothetical protein